MFFLNQNGPKRSLKYIDKIGTVSQKNWIEKNQSLKLADAIMQFLFLKPKETKENGSLYSMSEFLLKYSGNAKWLSICKKWSFFSNSKPKCQITSSMHGASWSSMPFP